MDSHPHLCQKPHYFLDDSIHKSKWFRNIFIFTITATIITVIIYNYYGGGDSPVGRIVSTIIEFLEGEQLDSTRDSFNQKTIAAWNNHPIFGYGWGSYKYFGLSDYGIYANAHNVYLQLLAETGVVGFISFMALALYTLVYAARIVKSNKNDKVKRTIACFCLSSNLFFLFYCLTGNCLYEGNFYIPFFVSIMLLPHLKEANNDAVTNRTLSNGVI